MRTALVLALSIASTSASAQSVYVTAEPGAEELEAAIRAELEALDIRLAREPGDAVQVVCAADGSVEVRTEEAIARFTPDAGEEAGARIVRAAEFVRARLLVAPELRAPATALADPSAGGEPDASADPTGVSENASDPTRAEEARDDEATEDEAPDEAPDDATEDEADLPSAPDPPRRTRGLGTSVGVAGGAWLTEGDLGPQALLEARASFLLGDLIAIVGRFFYQISDPTLHWTDTFGTTFDSSARFAGFAVGAEVRFSPLEFLELGVGAAIGGLRFDATGRPTDPSGVFVGRPAGTWLFWSQATASVHAWFHENVGVFVSGSAGLASGRVVVALEPRAELMRINRLTVGTVGPFVADVSGGIEARWEY
jgi:hypothetical protein